MVKIHRQRAAAARTAVAAGRSACARRRAHALLCPCGVSIGGKILFVATLLGVAVASVAPARGQAAPQEEPPLAARRIVHEPRAGFLAAGGVAFGLSYGAALLVGMFATTN